MPADQRKVDLAILDKATTLLKNYFGTNTNISSAEFLSEPNRRNALLRLSIEPKNGLPKNVILKQHLPQKTKDSDKEAFERFARDYAAHLFFGQQKNYELVPKLYDASLEDRFILIEDLGHNPKSLVDPLMGTNKKEALSALLRYTTQIAKLHGLAYHNLESYNNIYRQIKSITPSERFNYDDAIREIVPVLNNLGIIISSDIKNEIKQILKILRQPGDFTTLIHGDICPDNIFDDPKNNKLRIIDFEWSTISNALLDGVYIRMNMPTCWCARAFPKDIIDILELNYKKELAKNIPAASDDKLYLESYSAACAYWMLWNITMIKEFWHRDSDLSDPKFLNLHKDWRPEYQLRRPRVLSRLQAFIEISYKYDLLPNIRELALLVLNELNRIWPEVEPMGLYPVFL